MARRCVALLGLLCLVLAAPIWTAAAPAHVAPAKAVPTRTAAPQPAPSIALRVLRRLPHDPQAFTEGLILRRGVFYESTGLYGASSLRRVEARSGRILARTDLDRTLFGEGLALCGTGRRARLIQLTWREGLILVHNPRTLRETCGLALSGEGWGLAADHGCEIVMSDGSDTLRWLDPATLRPTGKNVRVRDAGRPVVRLNELEWVNGWLLANVWKEDRAAVIDPRDGRVAAWLDLAPLRAFNLGAEAEVANGLAYDPERRPNELFVTGKRWNAVFDVALPRLLRHPPATARAARPARRR